MNRNLFTSFRLLIILPLGLAACNLPGNKSGATATLNVTQAYQTVEARLTQAILASPPAPTAAPPTATQAAATTETSSAVTPSITPSPKATSASQVCDQAEAGSPIDVSIPDDTQMNPGQSFTKTWRLRNSGACTWSKDYSIAVFSGEAMNAPNSVPLPNKFDPGQSMDISVDLIAPSTPGTYQGNWKLRNTSGTWFGIGPGGSSPFWVRIKVVSNGTTTATVTPGTATPATPTFTPTPTLPGAYPPPTEAVNPGLQVSGSNSLAANSRINLDTNQVNPGGGEDLAFQPNANNKLVLIAQSNAIIRKYGGAAPSYQECKTLLSGGGATTIANLTEGLYFCYRTDQGLYGWLRIQNFNANTGTLAVQINTWALP